MLNKEMKIALLIDAENISEKYTKYILDEITKYGTPTYKRIYGDWRQPALSKWRDTVLNYSIIPMHQFAYTKGKNASDSAMIIDAMDILYSGKIDGFCIVTSDSDFTRLASRVRESGMFVLGMGEKKTADAFRTACDKFIELEVLLPVKEQPAKAPQADTNINKERLHIRSIVRDIINDSSDVEGYSYLAEVGNILSKRKPDFDARAFGYLKFSDFIKSFEDIEIKKISPDDNPNVTHYFIKNHTPVKKTRARQKK